jgi:Opioid growth factor receptor (OGFr) conserved region
MSEIVEFYSGRKKDWRGRSIEEMWAYSHEQLEDVHSYIQWLFPLRTMGVAPAPLLDAETITAFRDTVDLRERLLKSFDVMLDFYGLRRQGDEVIETGDFPARAASWLTPYNHNFLRITRILTCLRELGLGAWSRAFFRCLEGIYGECSSVIGAESFRFWRNAAT